MSFKDRWHKEKAQRTARKAAKYKKNTLAIGIGWYSREQWDVLTRVVPDRSVLDDTYEDWEAQATDALQMLAAQGSQPIKVHVNVQELIAWCRSKGRPVDGEARADFVGHLLAKHPSGEE